MSAAGPFGGLKPGHYAAVSIDPPWTYRTRSEKGNKRSAQRHYATMSVADITAMPIRSLLARDAWVFLWTTGNNLNAAIKIMEERWQIPYSSMAFVWVKTNRTMGQLFFDKKSFWVGMGYTTRKNAEFCLLGRIGRPKRLNAAVHELILAPRREHSRKPDEAYDRIQRFCSGPYLELFARESREGWDTWGDQATKFDKVKTA